MAETVGNFKMKVGRVNFIVEMKPSERAKVSYEEELTSMIRREALLSEFAMENENNV